MKKNRTGQKTRRQFLSEGAALAAISAPIVNALLPQSAHAIALPNPGGGSSGGGSGTGGGGSGGGSSGGGGCSGGEKAGGKPRKK